MSTITATEHKAIGSGLWSFREQAVSMVAPQLDTITRPAQRKRIKEQQEELIRALDGIRDFMETIAYPDLDTKQASAIYDPGSKGKKLPRLLACYSEKLAKRFQLKMESGNKEERDENRMPPDSIDLQTFIEFYEYNLVFNTLIPTDKVIKRLKDRRKKDVLQRLIDKVLMIHNGLNNSLQDLQEEAANEQNNID